MAYLCILYYNIPGGLVDLILWKLRRCWLRDHSPHVFVAALPDSWENCLAWLLLLLQTSKREWRNVTSAVQEGRCEACYASSDVQERSYLYSVGSKAQSTGSRSSRNNKHFITPCLGGHCRGGRGHVWVSILRRLICAASAGSDWEEKIHVKTTEESPKHLFLAPLWQLPFPLSPDKLEPLGAVTPVRTKLRPSLLSWTYKLLKIRRKGMRGRKEWPWVCCLIKTDPNWNPPYDMHKVFLQIRFFFL